MYLLRLPSSGSRLLLRLCGNTPDPLSSISYFSLTQRPFLWHTERQSHLTASMPTTTAYRCMSCGSLRCTQRRVPQYRVACRVASAAGLGLLQKSHRVHRQLKGNPPGPTDWRLQIQPFRPNMKRHKERRCRGDGDGTTRSQIGQRSYDASHTPSKPCQKRQLCPPCNCRDPSAAVSSSKGATPSTLPLP